jgi:uncharacterized protein (UPF0332 family)
MKRPETVAYIAKALQSLKEARIVAANELPDAAGRAAYLAAYHAAQASVFDATGKVAKTHNGVRSEFRRLTRADPRIERGLPTFLAQAYSLKENADYAVGHATGLTLAEAEQAIETATRFVDAIARLLETP